MDALERSLAASRKGEAPGKKKPAKPRAKGAKRSAA
jgi:hypothetical protein